MASKTSSSLMRVSKSTLSMYLRTKCEKELYLSLHDKSSMAGAGLPAPVKRPGIGVLSVDGREFELTRNDQLVRVFGGAVEYKKSQKIYEDLSLEQTLRALSARFAVILQARFSISSRKIEVMKNIGLVNSDALKIPNISDFIPDIIIVREAEEDDSEVLVDSSRRPIDPNSEVRLALDIIDVKHTGEANPSYCAEIAMYCVMLANWLSFHPDLATRYFVSSKAYLWTRFKQGESELDRIEKKGGATPADLLTALVADSEDANLRFYLAAVRSFFDDIVKVLNKASSGDEAWQQLEWHVRGTCSSCDWLGDKRHLSAADRTVVDASPLQYCMPCAKATGHLSLVPGVSRGAKKVLQRNNVGDAYALAVAHQHPAFQQHTLLKREAKHLPARTSAVLSGQVSNNQNAAIASLAKSANLLLYVSVNFDSSAGLLTGLSLSGVATGFVKGQPPTRYAAAYIVDQKALDAEWVALEALLNKIAECVERSETLATSSTGPTGQIHFWEERQLTELCNAMGRHLPKVLALANRKAKALAWLFPPDELLATPGSLEASTVVIVDEIVRRLVFTPTAHVITLFDTAEVYNNGYPNLVRDSYYREYLSNGIPRERIYELWGSATQVKRGSQSLPRNNVVVEYADALTRQAKALESICDRLRSDYANQIRTAATRITSSIPRGSSGVSFDAKLWIWWDSLDFNASQLERQIRLSIDGDRLEATYEAIILSNGKAVQPGLFEFDVAATSTEAKFKEDSRLTIGKIGRPGMPLERAARLIAANSPQFQGDQTPLNLPLWSALSATLVSFDRVNRKAEVAITCSMDQSFVPYLLAHSTVDLLNDVFLLETKNPKAFDWSKTSATIFAAVGDPPIAFADPNASRAMGITSSAKKSGSSPTTPLARVLWEPNKLQNLSRMPELNAHSVASFAGKEHGLNSSQIAAVKHAAQFALTLIWGPPGTGKTNTLAALIHSLANDATSGNRPLRILVTGPTYKAVEEVLARTCRFMNGDAKSPASVFMCYSKGRNHGAGPVGLGTHLSYETLEFDDQDQTYAKCANLLLNGKSTVLVGAQIRQARRFTRLHQADLAEIFDVLIIDESSQVPVSQSVSALAALKTDSRVVVAGDHLQMPPITSIDPPATAEYMVGSIQTYLTTRKFQTAVEPCVLATNYRSCSDLVSFAKRIGYPQDLEAAWKSRALRIISPLRDKAQYPSSLPWAEEFKVALSPAHPVVTLLHDDEVSSQGNHFEARIVAGLVWMLRQSVSEGLDGGGFSGPHQIPDEMAFWRKCVGIVTPHRAQRALVIRELEQLFPQEKDLIDEAVDTVERFQGGERHTIIVTFGVADTDVIAGEEAFLMQLERTNVAVSRAMAKCIVVMPSTLAAHIPQDKKALMTAFALKDYIENFCNVRSDATIEDGSSRIRGQLRYHSSTSS